MACINSRMLSTTVASPCQILSELLAGHHEYINPYKQPSPSISSIAHEVLDHVMPREKDAELWTAVLGFLALISRAYRNFSLWHHGFIKATRSAALVIHMHGSPRVFHASRVSEQAQGKNGYIVNIIFLTLLCILHVTGSVQWMFSGETLFNLPTEGRQGL